MQIFTSPWKLHCLQNGHFPHSPHIPHLTTFHTSSTSQHSTQYTPHSIPPITHLTALHTYHSFSLFSLKRERAGGYHASSLTMTQMPNSFAFKWWRECPCFLSETVWDGGCPSILLLQCIHREPGAGHAGEWVGCSAVDGCTNTHTCTQTMIFLFYLLHTDLVHIHCSTLINTYTRRSIKPPRVRTSPSKLMNQLTFQCVHHYSVGV